MIDLILVGFAILIVVALIAVWIITSRASKDEKNEAERGANILPGARRRQLGAGRNIRQRARVTDNNDDDDGEEEPSLDIQLPEGKVGAKKLAKLQAKAERKANREADERERAERKKKQEIDDEERKKAEEKEKADERKKEEEEKRIQAEKERREHEEYLKLKEAFSVEAEGFDEEEAEGENALQDFVNHIKKNKVVVIEDIAAQFKLKTQQAIDRIQQLQTDGILSGVIDDRGKFIYISREELAAVAKFVKQRGRVSISELVDNSNMLIDLTPAMSIT